MAKAISLVLVVLALSVLVVGCGGNDAPATETDATGDATAQQGADVAIDEAVLSESDDVQIGELIE